jgi:hypothetical protein
VIGSNRINGRRSKEANRKEEGQRDGERRDEGRGEERRRGEGG